MAADFPRFYGMALSRVREHAQLWEFAAMAANLPRESATWRSLHGQDRVEWDLSAQILADMANSLRLLAWYPTNDGAKGRRRPEMLRPPWVEDESKDVTRIGSVPVPLDDLDDFLGWSDELAGTAPLADPPQPRDSRGRFMRRP